MEAMSIDPPSPFVRRGSIEALTPYNSAFCEGSSPPSSTSQGTKKRSYSNMQPLHDEQATLPLRPTQAAEQTQLKGAPTIKQEGGVFGVQVRAGPQGGVPGLKDGNVIFGGAGKEQHQGVSHSDVVPTQPIFRSMSDLSNFHTAQANSGSRPVRCSSCQEGEGQGEPFLGHLQIRKDPHTEQQDPVQQHHDNHQNHNHNHNQHRANDGFQPHHHAKHANSLQHSFSLPSCPDCHPSTTFPHSGGNKPAPPIPSSTSPTPLGKAGDGSITGAYMELMKDQDEASFDDPWSVLASIPFQNLPSGSADTPTDPHVPTHVPSHKPNSMDWIAPEINLGPSLAVSHPQNDGTENSHSSSPMILQGQPISSRTHAINMTAAPAAYEGKPISGSAPFHPGGGPAMCVGRPIGGGDLSGGARTSCSGALQASQQQQQQQQEQMVGRFDDDADLLSWLEDPGITETARAAQAEGAGEMVPGIPSISDDAIATEAAAAAAEAAAMAVVAPQFHPHQPQQPHFQQQQHQQHQQQFGTPEGLPFADFDGTSFFGSSGMPFPFPDSDPTAAAAAVAAGWPNGNGGSMGMDVMSMLDPCNLPPGLGGSAMGFGGPMMGGMSIPGMNGMFGNGMGGMGMFGGSFMGMNPCMPGFGLAPGMPGSLMCGGGSGRGGASKGGSGGGGKKQRENLPKQSVVILKTWMYDHINHPYPSETEKCALMQATGLDLLQLNNWFINARVRIWRPIIVTVYHHQFERLMAVAQAQGDEQAMDKLREALSNPPAQLNIILGDAYSTECLHQEAQRAATEVHQQGGRSVPVRLQHSGGSGSSSKSKRG